MEAPPSPLTCARYLRVSELLLLQQRLSAAHDELQFIVVHQVFKCGSNWSFSSWRRYGKL